MAAPLFAAAQREEKVESVANGMRWGGRTAALEVHVEERLGHADAARQVAGRDRRVAVRVNLLAAIAAALDRVAVLVLALLQVPAGQQQRQANVVANGRPKKETAPLSTGAKRAALVVQRVIELLRAPAAAAVPALFEAAAALLPAAGLALPARSTAACARRELR